MLYLISTPIGTLSDITFRAIETLKKSTYILCEDTRHSRRLLDHYEIKTPLKSYHKFNEKKKLDAILTDLKNGLVISLISDAGTPGISDPGEDLVKACIQEGLAVTAVPGPCAAIAALSTSGCGTSRFQFIGFLPKKRGELQSLLADIAHYPGTTIAYESPHRILALLEIIAELSPNQPLVVMRELTKKFESAYRGSASTLIPLLNKSPPKGEFVLLFDKAEESSFIDSTLSIEEHVLQLQQQFNLSLSEAIKVAAKQRGVPKNTIYSHFHQ